MKPKNKTLKKQPSFDINHVIVGTAGNLEENLNFLHSIIHIYTQRMKNIFFNLPITTPKIFDVNSIDAYLDYWKDIKNDNIRFSSYASKIFIENISTLCLDLKSQCEAAVKCFEQEIENFKATLKKEPKV